MQTVHFMAALHTRRFWLAIVSGLLVVLNQGLGLGISPDTVMSFAGIMIAAVLGDAYVHGKIAAAVTPATTPATSKTPAPSTSTPPSTTSGA